MTYHSRLLSKVSVIFFIFFHFNVKGQSLFQGASAYYDDVIDEWEIYYLNSDGEEQTAEMRIKWPFRNDLREWQIDFEESTYQIRLKFNYNPEHWILEGFEEQIVLKQKWRSDPNKWVLSGSETNIKWTTDYTGIPEVWFFEIDNGEYFEIWTLYEGDYRDWEINDQAPSVSDIYKLGAIFTTIFQSNLRF